MNPARVLVLGGGYAGLLAALRIARHAGPRANVTLVDARESFCERVRLHQTGAGQPRPERAYADWTRGTGARFLRARALAIDPARRQVRTETGTLDYDRLVVALGSRTDTSLPGAREHARVLDAPDSALTIAEALRGGATRVTVVGGGLTAIEAATELAQSFPQARVTLATASALGRELLSARALLHLRAALARLNVTVAEGVRVSHFQRDRVLHERGELAHDLAILCTGFVASDLAAAAGLAVDARGRMLVDAQLACVAQPEIRGAGDAAIPVSPLTAPSLMSCRLALPMAAYTADDVVRELAGAPRPPFHYADVSRCLSLGRHDGILQLHAPDGRLRAASLRGRAAAWVKERICRGVVTRIAWERHFARRAARGSLPRLAERAA